MSAAVSTLPAAPAQRSRGAAPASVLVESEAELAGLALSLGARSVRGWSAAEERLARRAAPATDSRVRETARAIRRGEDPLGTALILLRSPRMRRALGATYTPAALVAPMIAWAAGRTPARVVDPGAGSGRFLVAAGRRFPRAELVAAEIDALPALLTRAHLAAAGFGARARVVLADFRELALEPCAGSTLFVGNPPYVRHHGIEPRWKQWFAAEAAAFGLRASGLAGLHVHFLLAIARAMRTGDRGVLVTSAEWLDVNYGALARSLCLGPLGLEQIHLVEPAAAAFDDADSTAAVLCFEAGVRPPSVRLRRVPSLGALAPLAGGRAVSRNRLAAASRWTPFTRPAEARSRGLIELGEICRVHRGQVTGKNAVWIQGAHGADLPARVLHPSVTRARELFAAGPALGDASALRRVIDLPVELDELARGERAAVERFLRLARSLGADRGFVATRRRAWWAVGLAEPAPILATYMARRPPAFVRNTAGARHINIAHGLYPREPLSERALDALSRYLSEHASLRHGRTYAGGLTKFEPREMERLLVPSPENLLCSRDSD